MRRLAFDIEANDLYDNVTQIWCLCAVDVDNGAEYSFGPDDLQDGLRLLEASSEIIGHNILSYDLPVLQKILGWVPPEDTKTTDTLLFAKLCHSDLAAEDAKSRKSAIRALGGRHGLKAWGVRLGILKGDYGDQEDAWEHFSQEMLDYCSQDCKVTAALYKHLEGEGYSAEALDLEHRFARITFQMSERGFTLNREKCQALYDEIKAAQSRIAAELQAEIPGTSQEMKTPAYYRVSWPDGTTQDFNTKKDADTERKARGVRPKDFQIEAGPNKVNHTPFNPGSRQQCRKFLYERYGWYSPTLTDSGFLAVMHKRSPLHKEKLKSVGDLKSYLRRKHGTPEPNNEEIAEFSPVYGAISEETLSECDAPEAEKIARYLTMGKRLGQIGDGENAWLKLVHDDGRIRHRNDTIGCATMRNSHSRPNLGQVPHIISKKDDSGNSVPILGEEGGWGWECRDCFEASEGYDLVGADLSGIEYRMLGHFLFTFDGGEFIDTLLNGDVHQKNADAMTEIFGFEILRNDVKSPAYAVLYGAGLQKLGQTLARDNANAKAYHAELVQKNRRTMSETEAIREAYVTIGRKVKEGLERGIRGLGELQAAVRSVAERGYLTPLDKRRIPIRSPHSALNSLLQGAAAICMKRWVVLTFEEVKRRKWDCHLLAVVHDEVQVEVRPEHTQDFSNLVLSSIEETDRYYRLHCPLSGESKVGRSWAETH